MIKNFEEIITLQRGFDLPKQDRDTGGHPLVSANGISDYISKYKVTGPGVVTGRSGTIGNVFYVKNDFWPLNTTLFVKDFHGNNVKYISYWLSRFDLIKYANGASVPTLNRNELNGLKCIIHTPSEQQHIVNTIGSVDDLIENHNRQIQKILSIGDLLICQSTNTDSLAKYANISLGGTPSRSHPEYWNGTIKWINSGAMTDSPAIMEQTEFITELGVKNSATKCANEGDTVLSIIDPGTNKVSVVLDNKVYFNQSVICLSAKNQNDKGLIYFGGKKLVDEIKGYATGAAQQSLNKEMFEISEIHVPDSQTIEKLNKLLERIMELEKRIRFLNRLKIRLLSKYF